MDPDIEINKRIQMLIDQRQQHADALANINQTLSAVAAALESVSGNGQAAVEAEAAAATPPKKRRGRPPGVRNATPAPAPSKSRRSRGSYATTGEESVLAFIKSNKKPTTSEIKAHWASESRLGTADNVLSKLFRERKVKRTPLGKGIRGSRYSLI
jgi:hypothetical protein